MDLNMNPVTLMTGNFEKDVTTIEITSTEILTCIGRRGTVAADLASFDKFKRNIVFLHYMTRTGNPASPITKVWSIRNFPGGTKSFFSANFYGAT